MDETLTLVEKTAFLKGIEVLSGVPTEALAQLASRTREIHFDAGDVVFAEGEPNRGTFLVVDGLIELRKGRALVRLLQPGGAFGELFSGEGAPHFYTAVAVRHTHALNITLDEVFDGMLDFPEFGVGMVRSLAERNHELVQRLLELESLLGRFHAALRAAGLEPPDARLPFEEGMAPGGPLTRGGVPPEVPPSLRARRDEPPAGA